MFYLIDDDRKCYRLKNNVTMTIGRVQCDITLRYHQMGRKHATITVRDDEVLVEDERSVNGTSIDGEKLEANTPTKLPLESTLTLASSANLRLKKLDLIVTSLGLKPKDIASLKEHLNGIGVEYVPHLTDDCTLIASTQIEFDLEFVSVLKQNVRFVRPTYVRDLSVALAANKPIPDAFEYFPEISAKFPSTVDPNFFEFNKKRNVLFAGKMFVCKTDDEQLPEVLDAAGGTVVTDCDPVAGKDVFMVCGDNELGNSVPSSMIPITAKNIMTAILFVDCRFLTVRNRDDSKRSGGASGGAQVHSRGRNASAISSNGRSLLHAVENERFSEDVFSTEVTQTKRKRQEIGDFFKKKPCASSTFSITNQKASNQIQTNDNLDACFPDMSVVKWTLAEDNLIT